MIKSVVVVVVVGGGGACVCVCERERERSLQGGEGWGQDLNEIKKEKM